MLLKVTTSPVNVPAAILTPQNPSVDIHRTVFMYGHDTLVPPYTLVHKSKVPLQAETPGAYGVFSF
ncbi:hypothetical protein PAXINDRAFT_20006 [Paxillus involutus ATCC 200175]|uniref:Uncharacterized protein n=1 Tax=Paxillus involutus ATCC 200175 TaxID=664439 RepID=A0A0C9SMU6_PAXIN|nr:hypothetical protein PAXINDRAFT_20006 [Paxillus involutus ATCC 200175]